MMQLTYRSIRYTPCTKLPTTKTIKGSYRGIPMTLYYSSVMPIQPFINLRYRGVSYRPVLVMPLRRAKSIAL